ncbi:MAG: hypothetical protein KIT17_15455 [Rubrivivax sp.]|nr:hypothetical protein [Rubrivivax sp.]
MRAAGGFTLSSRINDDALNARLKAVQEESAAFYAAVGRMVLAFSDAEHSLYLTLLMYAGMPSNVGRAIASGMRASVLGGALRALIENDIIPPERAADLRPLLDHLGTLNTARDFIAHYGSTRVLFFDDENKIHISNVGRLNKPAKDRGLAFDARGIDLISGDLRAIDLRLERHRKPRWKQSEPLPPLPDARPWRYTQPEPVPKDLRRFVVRG